LSAPADGHPPLRGIELALATFALSLASFMNFLDLSIANVSVPQIAGDLSVSPTQGTWVITSFAAAEAVALPLAGWLGARFGLVRVFVTSTAVFMLTSLLSALAVNFPMLVGSRVLQGIVGASMVPVSQALLIGCYAPHQRGLALGLWTITAILAPIAGPLAGGWITENLSWRWIFMLNLPVGVVVLALSGMLLRGRESPTRRVPVDWTGLVLLTVGVGSLQLMLDRGNELDWFDSYEVIVLACAAAIALALFVAWELGDEHPIVDLRLFRNRNFTIGSVCLFAGSIAFYGTLVTLPLWLQTYYGYTSLWAGMAIATGGVFAVVLGPFVGANLHRIDARAIVTFGMVAFAAACLWSARFTPDVEFWTVAQARLYMGLGVSCFYMPLTAISMSALPGSQFAAASGLNNFIRIVGSSLGTAIMVGAWDRHGIEQRALLTERIDAYSPQAQDYLERLHVLGLNGDAALATIEPMIRSQAYLGATNWLLWACAMIMLGMIPLAWLARPPFVARAN